ncbi:MAG: hypothetical protein ACR2QC_00815 [Gammaproteobacteria bacterium]
MTAARRRVFAVAMCAAFVSSSAVALEKSVRYAASPLLSEERASAICKTFQPVQDRKNRVVRFICTRKFLYVCNREEAVLSADPEAAGKCFVERARNSD